MLRLLSILTLFLTIGVGNVWGTDYYVKVTSTNDITDGDYLIVYEDGNVAFNGSLTTLDATSNTISVSISDGTIEATNATNSSKFTISTSNNNKILRSNSGYYIGNASNSNSLSSSTSTAYTNTISIDNSGNATIVSSGGAYLRYNSASNQLRFRYYKSSSYSSQQAIQLYKFESSGSSNPTVFRRPFKKNFQSGLLYNIYKN